MTSPVVGTAAGWHATGCIADADGNGVVIPPRRVLRHRLCPKYTANPPSVADDEATVRIPARDAPDGEATTCRTPGIRLMPRG
jgi:hypothetical protein